MNIEKFAYYGDKKIKINDVPTSSKPYDVEKERIIDETEKMKPQIEDLQEKLYAEAKEGLIIIIQAIDAAGKDSTIKHVMSGVNPQGVSVTAFKQPSSEELAHGFLWRAEKAVPRRGYIGIMNRSYYEDVLVVKVHNLQKTYKMPKRCVDMPAADFFKNRYKHIRNYEEYLSDNGYRVIKIFLNVSAEKQKERFLERIDNPAKNWKFSADDLSERALWDEYQKAFEDMINETATKTSEWYVLPADQKWFTRYLVSKIILKTLKKMNPKYPEVSKEDKEELEECRNELLAQK